MIFLISELLPDVCAAALSEYGECVRLNGSAVLPMPVRYHPDMLAATVGSTVFVGADNEKTAQALSRMGIDCRMCAAKTGISYPYDAILNILDLGTHLFCREKSVCPETVGCAREAGRIIVPVAQGYTACSTATVGGGIITSDAGIYAAACKNGIDALLISPGGIDLPPYEYGFIGGACCETDDALIFFGDIKKHRDHGAISDFCRAHGKDCRSVGDFALTDFGGARRITK
ncbi:MAG: hypothetical protein MJ101_05960 [Clostridia bacterium]|nr:hypothetical protein [Clostridia bacterium]